jgi:hypothetical protein
MATWVLKVEKHVVEILGTNGRLAAKLKQMEMGHVERLTNGFIDISVY